MNEPRSNWNGDGCKCNRHGHANFSFSIQCPTGVGPSASFNNQCVYLVLFFCSTRSAIRQRPVFSMFHAAVQIRHEQWLNTFIWPALAVQLSSHCVRVDTKVGRTIVRMCTTWPVCLLARSLARTLSNYSSSESMNIESASVDPVATPHSAMHNSRKTEHCALCHSLHSHRRRITVVLIKCGSCLHGEHPRQPTANYRPVRWVIQSDQNSFVNSMCRVWPGHLCPDNGRTSVAMA